MRRLFFALLPDDEVRQAVQQISTALPLSARQRVPAENWHITLAFIGSVNEALLPTIMELAMSIKMPAITVQLDQLSYWQAANVLCLTCSRAESAANNLATRLATPLAALGLKLDTRPYCPHLTVARHVHQQLTTDFQPIRFNATEFALMESLSHSIGVVYQPLQRWQLLAV